MLMLLRRQLLLLLLFAPFGFAQADLVQVASPDRQIEVRLMVAQPHELYALPRIAYQVDFRGKRLLDTSYLGFNIDAQEPMLGENVGLISSKLDSEKNFNSLLAEYMQNGSLGRRISVEVRAYNDGIAFRYIIPRSTPLEQFSIASEETQFRFAEDVSGYPLVEQPGIGWVAIRDTRADHYAPMSLERVDRRTLISTLAPLAGHPSIAVVATSPMVSPWRVLVISADRNRAADSKLVASLQ